MGSTRHRRVVTTLARSVWHQLAKPCREVYWRWLERWVLAAKWAMVAATKGSLVNNLDSRLQIRLYGDSELCRAIYVKHWGAEECALTRQLLRPGDTYVDVGANIGLFTLVAADAVGPTGRVFSFEPAPRTFARLQANVSLNRLPHVSCHKIALSDQRGQAKLAVAKGPFDAWNTFGQPYVPDSFEQVFVATETWTNFAAAHGLVGKVALMKIDVEGWEAHVLAGGQEEFVRPDAPMLFIEFTDQAARGARSTCQALYQALVACGYQLFTVDLPERKLVPSPVQAAYPYANLLATKYPELATARLAGATA